MPTHPRHLEDAAPASLNARRGTETRTAYLYLAPAAFFLILFWFLPVIFAFAVSFTNWEGADTLDLISFVGWRNYRRTLADDQFWLALANTFNYVLYSVPLTLLPALGAALLVQRMTRASAFFRSVFFLPTVTTWVSVSIVWQYLYDIRSGPLNAALNGLLGIEPLRWLQEPRGIIEMATTLAGGPDAWPKLDRLGPVLRALAEGPSLSMLSVILTSVWRDFGFFMVILLAGLRNIDAGYYEAARIDGAGAYQRFLRITLPLLTPIFFFCVVIALIGAFRVFVPILVMTPGGGPGKTTSTLVYYMYEKGFVQWKLGLGSAAAYILFAIIFLLTLAQNRLLGRRVEYQQ